MLQASDSMPVTLAYRRRPEPPRQRRETLVLVRGERPGLSGIAFEIAPSQSLEDARQTLANAGVEAVLRAGRTPCVDQVLAFKDPKGTEIELYAEMDPMNDEQLGYYEPKPWHEDRPQRPKDWLGQSAPRNKWIPGAP